MKKKISVLEEKRLRKTLQNIPGLVLKKKKPREEGGKMPPVIRKSADLWRGTKSSSIPSLEGKNEIKGILPEESGGGRGGNFPGLRVKRTIMLHPGRRPQEGEKLCEKSLWEGYQKERKIKKKPYRSREGSKRKIEER